MHTHKHTRLATICQRNVNAIRVYLAAAAIIASECKFFCPNRIESKRNETNNNKKLRYVKDDKDREEKKERKKERKNALRLIHHGMMTQTINVQQKFSDSSMSDTWNKNK